MDLNEIELETGLDEVIAALDRGPAPPSFVLPANRFHVRKALKKSRRGLKSHIKAENAREILPWLPTCPDDRTHAILRGNFVLGDLVPAILAQRGRCHSLHVATLGLSAANARMLVDLQARNLLGDITLICSHYFAKVDKDTVYREVAATLKDRARLIVVRNHAKVICLPTAAGDFIVIEGSANLRSSDNLEQIVIFNDPDLAAWHTQWMNDLADSHE